MNRSNYALFASNSTIVVDGCTITNNGTAFGTNNGSILSRGNNTVFNNTNPSSPNGTLSAQ